MGIASDAYEKAKTLVADLNSPERIAVIMTSSSTGKNSSWDVYKNTDGVDGLKFLSLRLGLSYD